MGTLGRIAEQDAREDELGEEEIVERIFEAIIDQRLPPGTKLSEAALCEAFGVGRMRIRHSLLLLSSREVVDLLPNRGAFVASPSAEQAREVFEKEYLIAQINRFGGNISKTSEFVGMERSALHRKLKSLGV